MTFRAQAAADLPTFVNVDEFGESVDVDGSTVTCVLEGNGDTVGNGDGIVDLDTVMHVRVTDFAVIPVVGQRLTVAGNQADVVAIGEDQGMLSIRLRWFDS